jgi:hypothetical protein
VQGGDAADHGCVVLAQPLVELDQLLLSVCGEIAGKEGEGARNAL